MDGVTCVTDGDFIGVAAPSGIFGGAGGEENSCGMEKFAAAFERWNFRVSQDASRQGTGVRRAEAAHRGLDGSGTGGGRSEIAAELTRWPTSRTAPLEPRAAVAEWKDGALTVWTGTQRPFAVRDDLAETFHLSRRPRARADAGHGLGLRRKAHGGVRDRSGAPGEEPPGKPVKLVWTREEEFTWAYFRPAALIEISSGVSRDGRMTAWEFHNYNSGNVRGSRTPYDIANQSIEFHASDSPLRQGSYRGLAATANHFARETHMDELARAVKMDALEFRRRNLKDARLLAVFEAAAKSFGWSERKKEDGHGFGIAGGHGEGWLLGDLRRGAGRSREWRSEGGAIGQRV